LMSPQNHKRETLNWKGFSLSAYSMQFGDRKIWGATAIILRNLYERVYLDDNRPAFLHAANAM
jgi:hypothetical protein